MSKRKGFTLIELMIVIAIIAVIAAIAIPGLLQSQRASNERNASTSLKTLASAQVDFCRNDRDGNRVNDFWTMNLAALYTLTSLSVVGTGDGAIKLIELSIASADASNNATPAPFAAESIALGFPPQPKAGYWYYALISDQSEPGGAIPYRVITDANAVAVHNTTKWGAMCYPDSMSAGRSAYFVNENNTVFGLSLANNVRVGVANPPAAAPIASGAVALVDWPTDAVLGANFRKLD